ncbi:hypothetical protein HK405_012647, partial [Cladochytrium tenue]
MRATFDRRNTPSDNSGEATADARHDHRSCRARPHSSQSTTDQAPRWYLRPAYDQPIAENRRTPTSSLPSRSPVTLAIEDSGHDAGSKHGAASAYNVSWRRPASSISDSDGTGGQGGRSDLAAATPTAARDRRPNVPPRPFLHVRIPRRNPSPPPSLRPGLPRSRFPNTDVTQTFAAVPESAFASHSGRPSAIIGGPARESRSNDALDDSSSESDVLPARSRPRRRSVVVLEAENTERRNEIDRALDDNSSREGLHRIPRASFPVYIVLYLAARPEPPILLCWHRRQLRTYFFHFESSPSHLEGLPAGDGGASGPFYLANSGTELTRRSSRPRDPIQQDGVDRDTGGLLGAHSAPQNPVHGCNHACSGANQPDVGVHDHTAGTATATASSSATAYSACDHNSCRRSGVGPSPSVVFVPSHHENPAALIDSAVANQAEQTKYRTLARLPPDHESKEVERALHTLQKTVYVLQDEKVRNQRRLATLERTIETARAASAASAASSTCPKNPPRASSSDNIHPQLQAIRAVYGSADLSEVVSPGDADQKRSPTDRTDRINTMERDIEALREGQAAVRSMLERMMVNTRSQASVATDSVSMSASGPPVEKVPSNNGFAKSVPQTTSGIRSGSSAGPNETELYKVQEWQKSDKTGHVEPLGLASSNSTGSCTHEDRIKELAEKSLKMELQLQRLQEQFRSGSPTFDGRDAVEAIYAQVKGNLDQLAGAIDAMHQPPSHPTSKLQSHPASLSPRLRQSPGRTIRSRWVPDGDHQISTSDEERSPSSDYTADSSPREFTQAPCRAPVRGAARRHVSRSPAANDRHRRHRRWPRHGGSSPGPAPLVGKYAERQNGRRVDEETQTGGELASAGAESLAGTLFRGEPHSTSCERDIQLPKAHGETHSEDCARDFTTEIMKPRQVSVPPSSTRNSITKARLQSETLCTPEHPPHDYATHADDGDEPSTASVMADILPGEPLEQTSQYFARLPAGNTLSRRGEDRESAQLEQEIARLESDVQSLKGYYKRALQKYMLLLDRHSRSSAGDRAAAEKLERAGAILGKIISAADRKRDIIQSLSAVLADRDALAAAARPSAAAPLPPPPPVGFSAFSLALDEIDAATARPSAVFADPTAAAQHHHHRRRSSSVSAAAVPIHVPSPPQQPPPQPRVSVPQPATSSRPSAAGFRPHPATAARPVVGAVPASRPYASHQCLLGAERGRQGIGRPMLPRARSHMGLGAPGVHAMATESEVEHCGRTESFDRATTRNLPPRNGLERECSLVGGLYDYDGSEGGPSAEEMEALMEMEMEASANKGAGGSTSKKKRVAADSDADSDSELFPSIPPGQTNEERQFDLEDRLNRELFGNRSERQSAASLLADASELFSNVGDDDLDTAGTWNASADYMRKGKTPLRDLVRSASSAAPASSQITAFPDAGVFLSDDEDFDVETRTAITRDPRSSPTLHPASSPPATSAFLTQASQQPKKPRTAGPSQPATQQRVPVSEARAREQEQLRALARELQAEADIRRRHTDRNAALATGQLPPLAAAGRFRKMPASGTGWRTARDTETDAKLYFPLRPKARRLALEDASLSHGLLGENIHKMFRDLEKERATQLKAKDDALFKDVSVSLDAAKNEKLWVNKYSPRMYAPVLRPLRLVAQVCMFRTPPFRILAHRLHEICKWEGLAADLRTLMTLCEMTGGDIRSSLNTLQFLRQRSAVLSAEMVAAADVGQKDMTRGLFALWERVFTIPAGKNKSVDTDLERKRHVEKLLQSVSASGDVEKVLQGCFENYLNIPVVDVARQSGGAVTEQTKAEQMLDWLVFHDSVDARARQSGRFELRGYEPYAVVKFHTLFATYTRPELTFPRADYENFIARTSNQSIVLSSLSSLSPSETPSWGNRARFRVELVPMLRHILAPECRP